MERRLRLTAGCIPARGSILAIVALEPLRTTRSWWPLLRVQADNLRLELQILRSVGDERGAVAAAASAQSS
eukprot:3847391-Rhodomonas_salina.2